VNTRDRFPAAPGAARRISARRRAIGLALLACALLGGPGHLAQAGERTSCAALAVAQGDALSGEAAEFSALLESAVRRSPNLLLVDLADAVDPAGAQARSDKARAAADALAQARKAYDALDVDAALEQARRAIYLGAEAPLAQRREALTAALLLAGASRYYGGDEPGSRDEFLRLFGIDPFAHLDPESWSPEVLAVAESERAHGAAQRRGEATVRSEPVPARIYVDGIDSGVAPVRLHGLAPGAHNVTAVAPGYTQRDALLSPGVERTLVLLPASSGRDLLALEKQLASSFGDKDGDEAMRQVGRDAGAEQVLIARIELRGRAHVAHVLRLQVSDGKRLGEATGDISLGSARGLADADTLIRGALAP